MTFHKYLADSKMFEYDKHYRECQQQKKPFIKSKINPLHGHYSVNVDLMTCDYVFSKIELNEIMKLINNCLLYTSPSPRDRTRSRMPSSA